jgi:hypothetical protein
MPAAGTPHLERNLFQRSSPYSSPSFTPHDREAPLPAADRFQVWRKFLFQCGKWGAVLAVVLIFIVVVLTGLLPMSGWSDPEAIEVCISAMSPSYSLLACICPNSIHSILVGHENQALCRGSDIQVEGPTGSLRVRRSYQLGPLCWCSYRCVRLSYVRPRPRKLLTNLLTPLGVVCSCASPTWHMNPINALFRFWKSKVTLETTCSCTMVSETSCSTQDPEKSSLSPARSVGASKCVQHVSS